VQRHRAVRLPQVGTRKPASFGLRKRRAWTGTRRWRRHSDRSRSPATSDHDILWRQESRKRLDRRTSASHEQTRAWPPGRSLHEDQASESRSLIATNPPSSQDVESTGPASQSGKDH
jgi:hypothetical protein